jgi:hypothetical protein
MATGATCSLELLIEEF